MVYADYNYVGCWRLCVLDVIEEKNSMNNTNKRRNHKQKSIIEGENENNIRLAYPIY